MSDPDYRHAEENVRHVDSSIVDLTSSFSLASGMLALAGSFSREQVNATNLLQLNSITAMLELVREYGERGRRPSPAVKEALDLAKQVVAAAQAQ